MGENCARTFARALFILAAVSAHVARGNDVAKVEVQVRSAMLKKLQGLQRGKAARTLKESDVPTWGCRVDPKQLEACLKETGENVARNVCRDSGQAGIELTERRKDPCMRFACENPAKGLMLGGLCWWHSRFQQAAWQRAIFRPDQKELSVFEVERRLIKLYKGKVVELPAFPNWYSFSYAYRDLILQIMVREQAKDALKPSIWSQWAKTKPSPHEIFRWGRKIERDLEEGGTQFIYTKEGLFRQHSIVAFETIRKDNMLTISLVDSNLPHRNQVLRIRENEDQSTATALTEWNWEPQWAWEPESARDDLAITQRAWKSYCSRN